jgi:tetratricopeptide (TPR) repeat protein
LRNSLDPETTSTPSLPSSSLPSVASMAKKEKNPADRVAATVIVLALIAFVVLSYGFLNRMKQHGTASPVRSVSQFVNDLERQVMGYLGETKRAFEARPSGRQRAKKYVLVGYRYYKERKFERAVGAFDRAVRIDPKNAEAYFWRGRALMSINRYDEAALDFKTAVKLNPAHVDAYDNLGWLYAREGNYEEGIANLTKAIELKPDNSWAYYYRARIHHKMGEVGMAVRDAEEACRLGLQDACTMYERIKRGII